MAAKKGTTQKKTQTKSTSSAAKRNTSGKKRSASPKTSGSRSEGSGAKRNTRNRNVPAPQPVERIDYAITYEIFMWIVIALAVLIFVSLLGLCGAVGNAVAGVVFGLFGMMAYLFPFVVLFLTAFLIANPGSRIARIKAFSCLGLFITLCGWCQVILAGYNSTYIISEYYIAGSSYHIGGGLIGGAMTHFFASGLGIVGSYVIYILLTVIFGILITQKSIFANVKKKSSSIYSNARDNRRAREAWMRERQEQKDAAVSSEEDADTLYSLRDDHTAADPVIKLRPQKMKSKNHDVRMIHLKEAAVREKAERLPKLQMNQLPSVELSAQETQSKRTSGEEPMAMQHLRGVIGATVSEPKTAAKKETKEKNASAAGLTFTEITLVSEDPLSGKESFENRQIDAAVPEETQKRPMDQQNITAKDQDMLIDDPHLQELFADTASETEDDLSKEGEEVFAMPEISIASELEDPSDKTIADELQMTDDTEEDDFDELPPAQEPVQSRSVSENASGQRDTAQHAAKSQTVKEGGSVKSRVSKEEIQAGIDSVAEEIAKNEAPKPEYVFPPVSLLAKPSGKGTGTSREELMEISMKLQEVLNIFKIKAKVSNVTCGPSVTRFELIPELGVKLSKIQSLQDEIKLNLAVTDVRIEAPIPGKAAVGIEIPNQNPTGVLLRELIDSEEFKGFKSNLAYAVGRDIGGKIIVSDIAKMPHLLIAGATGSGKSVFINTLIMSILYKSKPEDVKLIMIDPKVVELSVYNGIPHLYIPVVTDPKKAAGALNWACAEMDKRYRMFEAARVRDIKSYNRKIEQLGDDVPEDTRPEKMPQIVIIVDELADLMMVASNDVETAICRLAQLARAAGIHLVIATQRPSVDVITGLIKANMPSRIAFSVSSGVDSRTVLDRIGAEKLIGNGDMLFFPQNLKEPVRLQGAYVSDNEVSEIVDYIKEHNGGDTLEQEIEQRMDDVAKSASIAAGGGNSDTDELFTQAGKFIIEKDKASIGMLQRWFKIGFNRAARIMDQLADAGVVGPEEGTKPRKVIMSMEQFENYLEQN